MDNSKYSEGELLQELWACNLLRRSSVQFNAKNWIFRVCSCACKPSRQSSARITLPRAKCLGQHARPGELYNNHGHIAAAPNGATAVTRLLTPLHQCATPSRFFLLPVGVQLERHNSGSVRSSRGRPWRPGSPRRWRCLSWIGSVRLNSPLSSSPVSRCCA